MFDGEDRYCDFLTHYSLKNAEHQTSASRSDEANYFFIWIEHGLTKIILQAKHGEIQMT
jgi:peptidyl-tRNA hydrolase